MFNVVYFSHTPWIAPPTYFLVVCVHNCIASDYSKGNGFLQNNNINQSAIEGD